jgi:hypothetical protein
MGTMECAVGWCDNATMEGVVAQGPPELRPEGVELQKQSGWVACVCVFVVAVKHEKREEGTRTIVPFGRLGPICTSVFPDEVG